MLHGEDSRGQIIGRVAGEDWNGNLAQDRTLVVFLGDQVDRGARFRLAAVQNGLVHAPSIHSRPTVTGEQGRMDVDDSAAPSAHDLVRDPLEEPRQDHEAGGGSLEGPPPFPGVGDIIEDLGRDPRLARHLETAGLGPVTHDQHDLRRGLVPEGAEEGRQIAASARHHDHDPQAHSAQI